MSEAIPANVLASNHGFPVAGRNAWIRARDLWPLTAGTDRACIEELCSRYQHYTGEAADTLSGIWARIGWPMPAEQAAAK